MTKTERIYKALRSGLDSNQTMAAAEALQTSIPDALLETIEKQLVAAKEVPTTAVAKKSELDVRAVELAEKLKGYVVARYPYYEKTINVDAWAKDIQAIPKIHESLTYPVVEAVMKWLFEFESDTTEFWQGQVRSGKNLRKHFLTLVSKAKDELGTSQIAEAR